MLCANVDKAVKILARFIVEDKTAVIKLLNDGNYASLPLDASIMEVNEAVANNIFDEKFVKKLADVLRHWLCESIRYRRGFGRRLNPSHGHQKSLKSEVIFGR